MSKESVPSRRKLASQARIRRWPDEPTSFGPFPKRKVVLVESKTSLCRPAIALPRIASEVRLNERRRDRQIHSRFRADINQTRSLGPITGCAPGAEKLVRS